jgi:hypothetical protein
MAVANVADTRIGRDVVSITLGPENGAATNMVQAYASCSRNIDIRTENLKSVKEFWDYDVALAGGATLELEFDVRDTDLLTSVFPGTYPYAGSKWCRVTYAIVWGNGDTSTGTGVLTKSNHSAPGEGKQKLSYSLKVCPTAV